MFRGGIFSADIFARPPYGRVRRASVARRWVEGARDVLAARARVRSAVHRARLLPPAAPPQRLGAPAARLVAEGLFTDVLAPTPAALPEVRRVHRATFLEFFRDLKEGFLDPETAVPPETLDIALLAAGGAPPASPAG